MTKIYKVVSLIILAFLQLFCLAAIFYDLPKNIPNLIFIFLIGLLISVGILKSPEGSNEKSYNNILLILFTIFGAIATYAVSVELNWGAVLASAIVGTLASFLPIIDKKSETLNEIPKAIYCGSFVGMTATFISQGYLFIFLGGLAAGILYVLSKNTFLGVGGKLGTMAFGGVIVAFFLLIYIP